MVETKHCVKKIITAIMIFFERFEPFKLMSISHEIVSKVTTYKIEIISILFKKK